MKVVILAGGLGTRLSEETVTKPKPMVEIGGKPILWHIMKTYSHYGINDFIICCGYKGYVQDIVLKEKINLENTQVYACGSNDMINSAKDLFFKNNLKENNFFSDAFVQTN